MDLIVEEAGKFAVITLHGEHLDASNAEDFKTDIQPILEANPRVLLDMSPLQFVDSSGLGAILSCLRRLTASGGDLKLCGMSKPVRAVFQITRMHRIFDIYDTREAALEELA